MLRYYVSISRGRIFTVIAIGPGLLEETGSVRNGRTKTKTGEFASVISRLSFVRSCEILIVSEINFGQLVGDLFKNFNAGGGVEVN